jgi:hypothetical protein
MIEEIPIGEIVNPQSDEDKTSYGLTGSTAQKAGSDKVTMRLDADHIPVLLTFV